mgnify:FL=1
MAQGNQRREGVQDGLAGAQVEVTTRSAAPLSVPQVRTPDLMNSPASKIARSLGQFSSKVFQDAANKQHEAAALDGQMAQMQGQAIEDVEMEGDKWKLSGYRMMDAQSISASMLAAQQEMIRQSQYEQDPDAFRATFVNRLEQQIDGLDPQTASMVRKSMAAQLPALVGQHTTAHMAYQEQEAFEALERSIDLVGADETQIASYLANVTGEGASGGLSQDRRTAAVVSGVARAFQQGNALPFATLQRGDLRSEFSTEEWAKMESAQKQYQSKLRTELNKEYVTEMLEFNENVSTGKFTASEAIDMQAEIMTRHGMKMTMQEGNAAGMLGQESRNLYIEGNSVIFNDAMSRQDYDTVAEMSFGTVVHHESRGNPNAVGPEIEHGANAGDRAMGAAQVMPQTALKPGYGIKPADLNDPQDVYRVGKELWARHINHYKGDVEAAAIAYNAGPANADKWLAAGRDYSVLPQRSQTEPYAKAIAAEVTGGGRTISATNRLQVAQAQAEATKEALNTAEYLGIMEAERALIEDFQSEDNTKTIDELRDDLVGIREQSVHHFTQASINHAVSVADQQRKEAEAILKKQDEADDEERATDFAMLRDRREFEYNEKKAVLEEQGDWAGIMQLTQEYGSQLGVDLMESGLTRAQSNAQAQNAQFLSELAKATHGQRQHAAEQAEIAHAKETRTVDQLPPELQEKYYEQQAAANQNEIDTVVSEATEGEISDEMQLDMAMRQEVDQWLSDGQVNPKRVAEMTVTLQEQNLLTGEGTANENVVRLMQQYHLARSTNEDPDFADSMFKDPKTRARAEAILQDANNSSDKFALADAIIRMAKSPARNLTDPNGKPTQELLDEAAEVANALNADGWITPGAIGSADIGIISALWPFNDKTLAQAREVLPIEARQRKEAQGALNEEVEKRVLELATMNPRLTAQQIGRRAQADVAARTVIIGGDVMFVPDPAQTPRRIMFGNRADEFSEPHHEHAAVAEWLAMKAQEPGFEWIGNVPMRETAQLGLGSIVPRIVNTEMFGDFMTMPKLAPGTANLAAMRGVRPFEAAMFGVDLNGKPALVVNVIDIDGNAKEVYVDMEEAGPMHMEKVRLKASGIKSPIEDF